jgi:hypothetical protein
VYHIEAFFAGIGGFFFEFLSPNPPIPTQWAEFSGAPMNDDVETCVLSMRIRKWVERLLSDE